jgi:hypothetical protein
LEAGVDRPQKHLSLSNHPFLEQPSLLEQLKEVKIGPSTSNNGKPIVYKSVTPDGNTEDFVVGGNGPKIVSIVTCNPVTLHPHTTTFIPSKMVNLIQGHLGLLDKLSSVDRDLVSAVNGRN